MHRAVAMVIRLCAGWSDGLWRVAQVRKVIKRGMRGDILDI